MFENTAIKLLRGDFICSVTDPAAFSFLNESENFNEMATYLQKIGRRIAKTSKESGYFLAYSSVNDGNIGAIKREMSDIKNNIAPIVAFFNLVLKTTGQEDILMYGSTLAIDTLTGKIDQDVSLRGELQSLGAVLKVPIVSTQRKLVENIFKKMAADGYLKLIDLDRSIYQTTAKVEYLNDIIKFIQESDETLRVEDDEVDPSTGSLL